MKWETKHPKRTATLLLALAAAAAVFLGLEFASMGEDEPIVPGPGVTEIKLLSDYYPALAGTAGDTEIYVLDSGVPGGSMLVLGGTHPNEPAGFVAAVVLIENCVPEEGVLYVIPRANHSAFTCTDPQEASPMSFTLTARDGSERTFRFGSRATNPIHQWPDPEVYVHGASGQQLSGAETRNLNRAYPGATNGTFTERVAYGVAQFIRAEGIGVTVDLHEASPEYPTINAVVAHERAMGLGAVALMNMQLHGMEISLEVSPTNLHGLTHRELGDYTDTLALLMETANASQGRLRGKTGPALVVSGKDPLYTRAGGYGALYVNFPASGIPLSERVARHITGVVEIARAYGETGGSPISLSNLPDYGELIINGLSPYLAPAQ